MRHNIQSISKDKEREKQVMDAVSFEAQLAVMNRHIGELEQALAVLREPDTPYSDSKGDFVANMGRTSEQFEELGKVVKYWAFSENGRSKIMKRIEEAPVKLRDKLIMVFIMMICMPPAPDSGPVVVSDIMRQLFGKR